ncbi:MAG: hypothetical protein EOL97_12645 [Spirochaetia bacterium]|nr:hypothetical protein [Spirochaetia bacterium]
MKGTYQPVDFDDSQAWHIRVTEENPKIRRLATQEEIKWLEACIKADDYIERTSSKEYVEITDVKKLVAGQIYKYENILIQAVADDINDNCGDCVLLDKGICHRVKCQHGINLKLYEASYPIGKIPFNEILTTSKSYPITPSESHPVKSDKPLLRIKPNIINNKETINSNLYLKTIKNGRKERIII